MPWSSVLADTAGASPCSTGWLAQAAVASPIAASKTVEEALIEVLHRGSRTSSMLEAWRLRNTDRAARREDACPDPLHAVVHVAVQDRNHQQAEHRRGDQSAGDDDGHRCAK